MQVKDRIQGGQKVKFPLGWMVFSTFDGKPFLPSQFKFYARGINERLWKKFYAPDPIVVVGSIQPQPASIGRILPSTRSTERLREMVASLAVLLYSLKTFSFQNEGKSCHKKTVKLNSNKKAG
jgi:hypothetical protein